MNKRMQIFCPSYFLSDWHIAFLFQYWTKKLTSSFFPKLIKRCKKLTLENLSFSRLTKGRLKVCNVSLLVICLSRKAKGFPPDKHKRAFALDQSSWWKASFFIAVTHKKNTLSPQITLMLPKPRPKKVGQDETCWLYLMRFRGYLFYDLRVGSKSQISLW